MFTFFFFFGGGGGGGGVSFPDKGSLPGVILIDFMKVIQSTNERELKMNVPREQAPKTQSR